VGDTLDSNIVETKSSDDLLASVGSAAYTFSEGNCYGDVTPPTITPIHPQNYDINVDKDSEIEVEICDDDSGVNPESIKIIIDGTSYSNKDINSFFYTGDSSCYSIRLVPKSRFKENTPVLVIFKAADFKGNQASKTIIFNISPETANCLNQLDDQIQELNIYQNELSYCLARTCEIDQLPQTGTKGGLSQKLGVPGVFSILALILLVIHPYWRNPESEDLLNKVMPKSKIFKVILFIIGFILSIIGVIDQISVICITTMVLYIGTAFLQLLKSMRGNGILQ